VPERIVSGTSDSDRLAQYPLVTADDRIRGVTPACGARAFQRLMTDSFQ
jgi:hypothetical protein